MKVTSLVQTWYKVAYAVIALIMALNERRSTEQQGALLGGAQPSLLEFVLTIVSDPYILVYATTIAWLTFTATTVSGASEPTVVVRYGSRARWLLWQARRAAGEAARLFLVTTLVAIAAGVGLPWSWDWGQLATHPDSTADGLVRLAQTPLSPVVVWSIQLMLTTGMFIALYVAASAVATFLVRRAPQVLALLIVAEFLTVLGLARSAQFIAVGGLVLVQNTQFPLWPLGPVVANLLVTAFIITAVFAAERRPHRSSRQWDRVAVTYGAIVAAAIILSISVNSTGSLAHVLTSTFFGAANDGLRFTTYVTHQLVFLGLTFVIVHRVQRTDVPRLLLLAVRHGRLWPWARDIVGRVLAASVLLHTVLLAVAAVITVATGGALITPGLSAILTQFVINGVLQVFVTTLVVIGVLMATASDRIAFATLAALIVAGLPRVSAGWVPVGLNMLGHLADPSFTPLGAAAVLSATAVGLVFVTYIATTNPASQRYLTGRIHAHH